MAKKTTPAPVPEIRKSGKPPVVQSAILKMIVDNKKTGLTTSVITERMERDSRTVYQALRKLRLAGEVKGERLDKNHELTWKPV